jgi:phospholipid/cholesterol/gamma-HCH transport system permease protein
MAQAELHADTSGSGTLKVRLSGDWRLEHSLPPASDIIRQIDSASERSGLSFDTSGLGRWDSGLLSFLLKVINHCFSSGISISTEGLPSGVCRLIVLATAVPEKSGARRDARRVPFLARIGGRAADFWGSFLDVLAFFGETFMAFLRMLTGRSRFRRSDLLLIIQECSVEALPIVSLISFLVGLILAFVGAIQLKLFGAQIYVADLVGIAMLRAMGAIMTGIIMAGRTGASFAAHLGTMQVNEEIDALRTTGISPIDYLVLPRIIVLSLMMPLLTLYADLLGILGGLFVAVTALDMNLMEYYSETTKAVGLVNLWIGLFSGLVFGVLVALSGCLRGMQCGRSASAVGDATRSAVVTGIVCIVVANAVITVACDALGI